MIEQGLAVVSRSQSRIAAVVGTRLGWPKRPAVDWSQTSHSSVGGANSARGEGHDQSQGRLASATNR